MVTEPDRARIPALEDARVLPIARGLPLDRLRTVAEALITAGLPLLEVSLNSPAAYASITALVGEFGNDLDIGAGTVMTPEDASRAAAAGATFLLSPHLDDTIALWAREHGVPYAPGALTPTETVAAWRAGAVVVKIFPAARLGPKYFDDLRGPLPHIPLLATGGIDATNAGDFLRSTLDFVAVGGWLVGDGSFPGVVERARRLRNVAFEASCQLS